MGSLPNLRELDKMIRNHERRYGNGLREQFVRASKRGRNRQLLTYIQHSQNKYRASTPGIVNDVILTTNTNVSGIKGGIGVTDDGQARYRHKHSMRTHCRHFSTPASKPCAVHKKNSGMQHYIWDDQMLKYLSAYSPIPTRSHRINPVNSYNLQNALAACRRRESMNSSIGAASIRRLISLNNRNCRHKISAHVQRNVYKSIKLITLANGLMCAVLIPIFGLQASNSIWHHREQWLQVGPTIGSILLSISMLFACIVSLITPRLMRKFGTSILINVNYFVLSLFLVCHLYPSIYTLLPAYILLGFTYSPSLISKITLLVQYANKLSCLQHDCVLLSMHQNVEIGDEHKLFCNRDQKIRRLARWYQLTKDLGCILGALLASWILACTSKDWNCSTSVIQQNTINWNNHSNYSVAPTWSNWLQSPSTPRLPIDTESSYTKEYYLISDHGERICGVDMCSPWIYKTNNSTQFSRFINEENRKGASTLISIYLTLSLISTLFTILVDKVQVNIDCAQYQAGISDTLLFASPLAYFMGTEQAYILGDYLRAFVSCTLGVSMLSGTIVAMGIMQAIVSCTLSMLLRHIKRIIVILAAFFFHSCILLALATWKPSSDDSALFYVLAAAWGACNGMWETLMLALVTLNHTNNITEIFAPLQALRFLGLGITFAIHGFICERTKILTLVILLIISVPPYAILEIRLETKRKQQIFKL